MTTYMRTSAAAITLAAAALLSGCRASTGGGAGGGAMAAPAAPAAPATPAGVTPALIATGDSIFNSISCRNCHGMKGVGSQRGPSLVDGPWLHTNGLPAEIARVITDGVAREAIKDPARTFPMRARGGPANLTDDQIKAVAAYVWSISRAKARAD